MRREAAWGGPRGRRGFTLVEIMIVVGIIGILAVVAIPAFLRAREDTRVSTFMNDLRIAVDAFEMYAMENGDYPPDNLPGRIPVGMDAYLSKMGWTEATPLGGRWDWDHNAVGITAGVTVIGGDVDLGALREVDARIDDGDLQTGRFRRTGSGGYSYVMVD